MGQATADRIRTARPNQSLGLHAQATSKGRYADHPALLVLPADSELHSGIQEGFP